MEVFHRNALLGVNELSDMAKDKVVSFSDVYALKGGIKDDRIKVYETTQMIERIERSNGYIEENVKKLPLYPFLLFASGPNLAARQPYGQDVSMAFVLRMADGK